MARHVCPSCGATVAGADQFCPTCGTFLEREDLSDRDDNNERFELEGVPPPGVAGEVICPSCGAPNPPGNRHCEECGARLAQGLLPTAPRPAVQATAGVRAVVAISALLLGVIFIALLFNIFGGEDDPVTAAPGNGEETSTTTTTIAQPEVLEPLEVECTIEGIGSFVCANLISGTDDLYQINWEDTEAEGLTATATIRFRTAVAISRIDWSNISGDDTRFQRNYRAQSLSVSADDSVTDTVIELENVPGTQSFDFSSLSTNSVTITVESAYNAQVVEENIFQELVIDEIAIIGRAATPTEPPQTGPTDPTEATEPTGATEPTNPAGTDPTEPPDEG